MPGSLRLLVFCALLGGIAQAAPNAPLLFRLTPHTDSVCFVNKPEKSRFVHSTPGTRFSPSRIRSD